MISLLAIPVTTPVLIVCCTIPEKVLSPGMLNSRCQLGDTEVDVEQMVAFDDVEGKGLLFGTGDIDMVASIGEVGRV